MALRANSVALDSGAKVIYFMSIKHNRKHNRLINFDYKTNGLYFVTICTKNREHLFGGVHHDFMCVNRIGSIVYRQWEWLFAQYPYIIDHGFIVMPNHIHGIVEIDRSLTDDKIEMDITDNNVLLDCNGRDRSRPVPTDVTNKLDIEKNIKPTKILSLSNIIGAFKTTSSKMIHQQNFPQFNWQRSFHDHIIKNEKEYEQIYKYVGMNPVLWNRDRNNI